MEEIKSIFSFILQCLAMILFTPIAVLCIVGLSIYFTIVLIKWILTEGIKIKGEKHEE
jgi:hypothetical protein